VYGGISQNSQSAIAKVIASSQLPFEALLISAKTLVETVVVRFYWWFQIWNL